MEGSFCMKKIEAIIRPEKLEELKVKLMNAGITGITISQVNGCGHQKGFTKKIRGNDVYLNTLYKVCIMTVVPDEKLDEVVDIIINVDRTEQIGDGKIFISDIDECIRIRTGERGEKAL